MSSERSNKALLAASMGTESRDGLSDGSSDGMSTSTGVSFGAAGQARAYYNCTCKILINRLCILVSCLLLKSVLNYLGVYRNCKLQRHYNRRETTETGTFTD